MDMFSRLTPSTTSPPSWKSSACKPTTAVITRIAAHGPRMIAASAPPIRCPDVPPATGKLIICAANMNAAITPIIGTMRSLRFLFVCLIAMPMNSAASR